MPYRRALLSRYLRSEIWLVILFLAFDFIAFPTQVAQRLNLGWASVGTWTVWLTVTAAIGLVAIHRKSGRLWRLFCATSIFLLLTLATICLLAKGYTGFTTYGTLAYSALLRLLEIPSFTLFGTRREE
ncbi:hypothetical protein IQ268_08630 [Oculatella sp. LEGE 06141]|uniref:hypothetical protein n=1 Tax=Oculatella sp. LEGE 06141 TaxID=1828648 RepID=UPI00188045AA|nr:hypothetical protein [Oculatella sp. LEGE 06141]MBE9178623.1 hypothetical protein [Oculatella sp. LEGE 06141]